MKFIDNNGEPCVVNHPTSNERRGQRMSKEELHRFAIEILAERYKSEGMHLIDINRIMGYEYPQFVMKSKNGVLYYVVVETAVFPTKPETIFSANYKGILDLAIEYNATPVFAAIALANATKQNMSELFCGDAYFVAFNGLKPLK